MDEKINITLKNEIEKVQSENDKKIKHLENELIEKENYINELKTSIGFIRNDFTNLKEIGKIFSRIINFGDLYLIEEGIQKKFNKKIKKSELLYSNSLQRVSSYNAFRTICCNKSFSIIILIGKRNGERFGGFTDLPLGKRKTSKNFFCFSFDKQKLYYNIKYVECLDDKGPYFENGFYLGFDEEYTSSKKLFCYNNDFGNDEDIFDFEAHRIYLE